MILGTQSICHSTREKKKNYIQQILQMIWSETRVACYITPMKRIWKSTKSNRRKKYTQNLQKKEDRTDGKCVWFAEIESFSIISEIPIFLPFRKMQYKIWMKRKAGCLWLSTSRLIENWNTTRMNMKRYIQYRNLLQQDHLRLNFGSWYYPGYHDTQAHHISWFW